MNKIARLQAKVKDTSINHRRAKSALQSAIRKRERFKVHKRFPHSKECDRLVVEGIGPYPACICGAVDRRREAMPVEYR